MSITLEDTLGSQIKKAESLLLQISSKRLCVSIITELSAYNRISYDVEGWKKETVEYIKVYYGEDSQQAATFQSYHLIKEYHYWGANQDESWNLLQKEIERCVSYLNVLIDSNKLKQKLSFGNNKRIKTKPHKIFISLKKEDQNYADALISLINFIIGADGDKLFCSSIPGYGIKLSHDIMDDLKAQFDNYEIYMIIIHSPRYYQSAVCLNEMGASWVLGTKFSSFMTKDCLYEQMSGVINRDTVCVNLNDESGILNSHLNDFKNDLISFFGLDEIDENKWENARGRFIKEVSSIEYVSKKTEVINE